MGKQIISVSRRTDIPAFYSKWFMKRVEEGYCTVVNPYNAHQVSRVSLKPEDVSAFVFWTRNAAPLIRYLPVLDEKGYAYYFLYTIIGYPRMLDPRCPSISYACKTFRELSKRIGPDRMIWRYDPLIISNRTTYEWHVQNITHLIGQLKAYTKRLIISIVQPYRKTRARIKNETNLTVAFTSETYDIGAYEELLQFIGKVGHKAGLNVYACSEKIDLRKEHIYPAKCIDDKLISLITNESSDYKKDPSQRPLCRCAVSKDIGVNTTCLFGCVYCYATSSIAAAEKNYTKHKRDEPSLI